MISADLLALRESLLASQKASMDQNDSPALRFKESGKELIVDKYAYQFDWLGRPIIQLPQDIVAFQQVVTAVRPTLIVETGIAHGGSLVLSSSLLCILDVMDGVDPRKSDRRVIGIDIDIRAHNRKALDDHPLRFKMELIEGSSIDEAIIKNVHSKVKKDDVVLVVLDSNHTRSHVLAELDAYARITSVGSYCIVFDTVVEDLPRGSFPDRPWDVGNNPKTAVYEWLEVNKDFEIDRDIDNRLIISVAPDGYIRRMR